MKILSPKTILNISCIIILFFLEVFYFRNILLNNALFGDSGDGRFCTLIAEHWFRVFQGKESFFSLPIFYPVTDSIAYSDMLLGFSFPYIIFRFFEMNMFLSYKYTLVFIHLFGTLAFFYFLNQKFRIPNYFSLIGTILFSYSNMVIMAVHTQLYAYYYLPFILILIFIFFKNLHNNTYRRVSAALGMIFILSLTIYTGYYIAYFLILFCLIFIAFFFFQQKNNLNQLINKVLIYLKTHRIEFCFYFSFFILLIIPFLLQTLPAKSEFGSRAWRNDVSYFLPSPFDLINLFYSNLIYGNLFTHLSEPHSGVEWKIGYTLGTIITFFSSFFIIFKISKNNKNLENKYNSNIFSILLCLSFSILFSILLCVKIYGIYSLWWFIYKILPGAGAMRAAGRFHVFLMFPISIVIASGLFYLFQKISIFWIKNFLKIFIFVFFIAEFTWIGGIHSAWNSKDAETFLMNVSEPPDGCSVVCIEDTPVSSTTSTPKFWSYQLDAWQIALKYDLKTINGYSGQFPKEWNFLNVTGFELAQKAEEYIRKKKISNACCYDLSLKSWRIITNEILYNLSYLYDLYDLSYQNESFIHLPSTTGKIQEDARMTNEKAGYLFFGPYAPMQAGTYSLTVDGSSKKVVSAFVDIVSRKGRVLHSKVEIQSSADNSLISNHKVTLLSEVQDLEIRLFVSEEDELSVTGYRFSLDKKDSEDRIQNSQKHEY